MTRRSTGPRRAAVIFIFITVFICVIIIPVLPMLVETFPGGDTARGHQSAFGTIRA
jgi:hypothetical protein